MERETISTINHPGILVELDSSRIPRGDDCYTVLELQPGEILENNIDRFGKELREFSYRPGLKERLCPYWHKTDHVMVRCDYLGINSLVEDDE